RAFCVGFSHGAREFSPISDRGRINRPEPNTFPCLGAESTGRRCCAGRECEERCEADIPPATARRWRIFFWERECRRRRTLPVLRKQGGAFSSRSGFAISTTRPARVFVRCRSNTVQMDGFQMARGDNERQRYLR